MPSEQEVTTWRRAYEETIELLKAELRVSMRKQAQLLSIINITADRVAILHTTLEDLLNAAKMEDTILGREVRKTLGTKTEKASDATQAPSSPSSDT